jgi:hypothetical protein
MSEESQKKSRLAFLAAVGALLALLPLGYFVFLREPPPAPLLPPGPDAAAPAVEAEPDAGPAGADLRIEEVSGAVEIRHGSGAYSPALLGTVLRADDALRTLDGRARLVAKDAYDVRVEPGTELEIQELADRLSKFRLGVGLLVARVEGKSGRRLEVAAKGSDAVASSSDGSFAVANNGSGTVAVGARAGEVELKAAGKAVVLRQGQQSIVTPGSAPSDARPIPASLFLKVDWPKEKETNRREIAVTGRTAPGAVLLLAGVPTKVEKDGRFKAAVKLREGKNPLAATSFDVGGHQTESRRDLTVDTTAPDSDIAVPKWKD